MTTDQRAASRAAGQRILLAHDLSAAAELAVGLVLHAGWPESTIVRVITSPVGVAPPLSSFAQPAEARAYARKVRETIAFTQERVAADLMDAGLAVETATVRGKPEGAIVAEADRFGADLVVVGARSQGSIAATLLGSVSRAVVENAACSVLVARASVVGRVLLATDGSPPARFATATIATWPMFDAARIQIVGMGDASGDAAASIHVSDVVEAAVAELTAGGRRVEGDPRSGEVVAEVVSRARAWPADLVVIGSEGRTPLLRRLLLGSLAHTVLDGVGSSVLVARPGETIDRAPSDG